VNLDSVLAEPIDWRFRAFPNVRGRVRIGDVAEQKWTLFESGFLFPVMVLKQGALEHNVSAMAQFCLDRGVSLAPHGKTSMAPQLFARQLSAGAWGITAATVEHARIYRAFGVPRILLANELVAADEARWVASERAADPKLDFLCYVDSLEGVRALGKVFFDATRPLAVLVELGVEGGRTGCRSIEQALSVARAVGETPGLRLGGVAGFEGIAGRDRDEASLARVDTFCDRLVELTLELGQRGAFPCEEIILSAGGSVYPDRVADRLTLPLDLRVPVRVVIRAGCYLTHDDGFYEQVSPFSSGSGVKGLPRLIASFELWAVVLSRPERGLAIVGFGKRDAPFDIGLPVPRAVRDRSGAIRPVKGMSIGALNDQHAYLALAEDDPLVPGDLLCCGISHPCLAFDKWALLPVVDDAYVVVDAIRTFF